MWRCHRSISSPRGGLLIELEFEVLVLLKMDPPQLVLFSFIFWFTLEEARRSKRVETGDNGPRGNQTLFWVEAIIARTHFLKSVVRRRDFFGQPCQLVENAHYRWVEGVTWSCLWLQERCRGRALPYHVLHMNPSQRGGLCEVEKTSKSKVRETQLIYINIWAFCFEHTYRGGFPGKC